MAFRGALLKPSEKNGSGRNAKPSRGISKQSRYEVLKEKIRNWWEDRFKVGAALQEIRDQKLYQHEHETFEEFCQQEYGFERAHAYRLIGFAEVKASVQMSPIGDKLVRESQARALAPVPEEKRVEVLEKAASRGSVTAKSITEAANETSHPSRWTNLPNDVQKQVKSGQMSVGQANALYDAQRRQEKAKEEPGKQLDKTGYVIPDSILEDWGNADSFRSTLNELHKIKLLVEKAVDKRELRFTEINQDTVIELTNAWTSLKSVLPYAVCPACQGKNRSKCTACKKRGFVSEFGYTHWFAKEVIQLREKAIKK